MTGRCVRITDKVVVLLTKVDIGTSVEMELRRQLKTGTRLVTALGTDYIHVYSLHHVFGVLE